MAPSTMKTALIRVAISIWILISVTSANDLPCQVNPNNTIVDCSNKQLEGVPSGIPTTTKTLTLSHNRLNKLAIDSFRGLTALETLDLSYNTISKLESDLFADQSRLLNLILSHNQVNKLSATAFNHIGNLKVLDLSHQNNGMSKTSWDALKSLSVLQKLFLQNTRLKSVNFGASVRLDMLRVLNFASNEITTLNNGDLASLTGAKLESLDISNNPLIHIGSECFSTITSVETLSVSSAIKPSNLPDLSRALSGVAINKLVLRNIGLTAIEPMYFADLGNSSLQDIDFSYNSISKLEGKSFGDAFRQVKNFDLYMNNISSVDSTAFTNFTSLIVVDFSNNSLTEIGPTMFRSLNGSNLEELYLHKNVIQTISSDGPFRGLTHLKYLKLSKNKISQTITGSEFEGLDNLEVLDLGLNSKITLSPSAFSNLTSLKMLYINVAHAKKADVTPSPFSKLKSLVTLDLSNNSMSSLGVTSFDDLHALETLYLQSNNLYSVWDPSKGTPKLFLRNLANLKHLDLSRNGFNNIPNTAFYNLTHLGALKLGNNKISRIPDGTFTNTKSLGYLELHDNKINVVNKTNLNPILPSLVTMSIGFNPFSCTCDLLWFRKWIDTTGVVIRDVDDCRCASPPDMVYKDILDYHPDERQCLDKLSLYAIIGMGVGSVLLVVIVSLAYIFRMDAYYAYHVVRAQRHNYALLDEDNDAFTYDAFVSFSHQDEDWVRNHLAPELEQHTDPAFKLCLHYRDFEPGGQIVDNITNGVVESRRTLCLISRHYLESNWLVYAMLW